MFASSAYGYNSLGFSKREMSRSIAHQFAQDPFRVMPEKPRSVEGVDNHRAYRAGLHIDLSIYYHLNYYM